MPLTYPDYDEIADFVGVTVPAALAAIGETWAQAAVGEWNQLTGYDEYLATADTVRRFDPSTTPVLRFDNGLLAAPTSVVASGTTLSSEQYYLLNPNRTPYFGMRFTRIWSGKPQSIVITGKWGGILDTDTDANFADARMGILQLGAANIYEAIIDAQRADAGLVVDWKEDDVSEKLGTDLMTQATNARKMGEQAALRHRWMGVWH